jgi:anti-sigma regulatory factor (Ser/Thr protein kinase)
VTLDAGASAAGEARHWLTARAGGLVAHARLPDLQLVISEIVTNAIRHGGQTGGILLAATPKSDYLCVQVTDGGSGFAPRPGAMGSDDHGGFGLFIVERLTRRWGMTREGARTRVWFEFDYEGPAGS